MLQSREIGVAANDIGVVMMPAVNRVKLLRPGSLFEDLSALRKGNDLIPVSVKNQERDFDFFDFLEDVIADSKKGSDWEKWKSCPGHLADRDKGCLKDESQAVFARSQFSGYGCAQGAAEEDDPFGVEVISRAQIVKRRRRVPVGSFLGDAALTPTVAPVIEDENVDPHLFMEELDVLHAMADVARVTMGPEQCHP